MTSVRGYVSMSLGEEAIVDFGSLPVKVMASIDANSAQHLNILTYNIDRVAPFQLSTLKACAEKLDCDVIALQGASSEAIVYCQKVLGEKWGSLLSISLRSSNPSIKFIFYRKPALILLEEKDLKEPYFTLSAVFLHKKTNQHIHIHNVCLNPTISYDEASFYCKKLLKNKLNNELAIVVGELGISIAPLHNKPENIVTGMVRLPLPQQYSMPTYSVGGFSLGVESEVIRQLNSYVIDLETGGKVVDARGMKRVTSFMSDNEKKLWDKPREVLCLDFSREQHEYTIQKNLDDKNIFVRLAVKPNNEQYIRIGYKGNDGGPLVHYLRYLLRDKLYVDETEQANGDNVAIFKIRTDCFNDLQFDDAISKLAKVKKEVSELDRDVFAQIKSAAKAAYVGEPSSTMNLCTLGLYSFYTSKLESRIDERVSKLDNIPMSLHEKVKELLKSKNGTDLNSYKYKFMNKLTGVTAKDDAEAEALILYGAWLCEVVHDKQLKKLEKAVHNNPMVEFGSPKLPKRGSFDRR